MRSWASEHMSARIDPPVPARAASMRKLMRRAISEGDRIHAFQPVKAINQALERFKVLLVF